MSYHNFTSAAGWRMLRDLAQDAHVIQAGFAYGQDTAYLARSAASVTCIAQATNLTHEGYPSALEQWHEILLFHGQRSKAFYMPGDPAPGSDRIVPGAYDLAVVDFDATAGMERAAVLNFALYASAHVAVHPADDLGAVEISRWIDRRTHEVQVVEGVLVIRPQLLPIPEGAVL